MNIFKTLPLGIILFLATTNVFGQIKVWTNNHVGIGYSGSAPTELLHINGSSYQIPQGSTTGGGFSFKNFHNNIDAPTGTYYEEPILEPQFNNAMWIGNWDKRIWQGYFHHLNVKDLYTSSDASLKKNIVQWNESAVSKIRNINAYRYDYDETKSPNTQDSKLPALIEANKNKIGFMAQNIQSQFPELVKEIGNTGNLGVNYIGLIPVLLEAIKEQQALIEDLQIKVKQLEDE